MKIFMTIAAVIATWTAIPATAQNAAADDGTRISIGVTGGTLGIGPEIGVRVADHFGVRGNATFLSFSGDYDSDDVTYNGKLKLKSYGVMADLYPFGSHFRVSAGARINRNRVDLSATPTGTTEIGGVEYSAAQIGTLSGRGETKKVAPALTLGWSGAKRRGFMFGFDAGVLFQGAVRVREFRATGALANDATFRANLETERRDLQDDVDDYKVYPIMQFAIGYRF